MSGFRRHRGGRKNATHHIWDHFPTTAANHPARPGQARRFTLCRFTLSGYTCLRVYLDARASTPRLPFTRSNGIQRRISHRKPPKNTPSFLLSLKQHIRCYYPWGWASNYQPFLSVRLNLQHPHLWGLTWLIVSSMRFILSGSITTRFNHILISRFFIC